MSVRILGPQQGDVLNRHDGVETAEALTVEVQVAAPQGAQVAVNGQPARAKGGAFVCTASLTAQRNTITATATVGGATTQDAITVLWDKGSRPRYRLSVDDNIQFLRDLGTEADRYPSLFDHWYLTFWRRMHEEYGAKIHLNIYYQTVTQDFTLAQLPDRWRGEWEANAPWLHLSFHALQDKPDRIYRNATYDQIARDYDLVVNEIKRFAGESVLTNETTVHWAEAPKEACRALHDRGIRTLIGIFRREFDGECTTGYYLPADLKDHIETRDAWYDAETDLLFVVEDATVNSLAVAEVDPWLNRQAQSPHTSELMELLIHEQYFRQELEYFQPDVQEKVTRSLDWVTTRGYEPVFWGEGLLGGRG